MAKNFSLSHISDIACEIMLVKLLFFQIIVGFQVLICLMITKEKMKTKNSKVEYKTSEIFVGFYGLGPILDKRYDFCFFVKCRYINGY